MGGEINLTISPEATYQAMIPNAPYVPTIFLIYHENNPISNKGLVKPGKSFAISDVHCLTCSVILWSGF